MKLCVKCEKRPAAFRRRVCNTCQDKAWREKYPVEHLYKNLKASAKRRGIIFRISKEFWRNFCDFTGFDEICGRGKGFASIDRPDPARGYEPDNVRVLEFSANSRNVTFSDLMFDETPF